MTTNVGFFLPNRYPKTKMGETKNNEKLGKRTLSLDVIYCSQYLINVFHSFSGFVHFAFSTVEIIGYLLKFGIHASHLFFLRSVWFSIKKVFSSRQYKKQGIIPSRFVFFLHDVVNRWFYVMLCWLEHKNSKLQKNPTLPNRPNLGTAIIHKDNGPMLLASPCTKLVSPGNKAIFMTIIKRLQKN